VACSLWEKVIIVDTTRKGFVSTITIHGDFVACNSKCHVITTDGQELQMQCGAVVFWKIAIPFEYLGFYHFKSFSPTEQYCILADSKALYVLDVALGRTLRTFQSRIHEGFLSGTYNCKFVSDEECVACFSCRYSSGSFFQLFNVKSGDLLSEIALEGREYSLAAFPHERLVAIGFIDSKVNLKVLQVKLPGDQHSSRSISAQVKEKVNKNMSKKELKQQKKREWEEQKKKKDEEKRREKEEREEKRRKKEEK